MANAGGLQVCAQCKVWIVYLVSAHFATRVARYGYAMVLQTVALAKLPTPLNLFPKTLNVIRMHVPLIFCLE